MDEIGRIQSNHSTTSAGCSVRTLIGALDCRLTEELSEKPGRFSELPANMLARTKLSALRYHNSNIDRNIDVQEIAEFVSKVIKVFDTGVATEHSYRPALETLLNSLSKSAKALNEPKRVACGAPDFIVQRKDLIIGHVEAKDLPVGLRAMKDANKNQLERYRKALPNLLYTNCLDWDFYRNGELVASVSIGHFMLGIHAVPENYPALASLLETFISQRPQIITSPKLLAEKMAGKAQLIKEVLHNALKADKDEVTELTEQYHAFKEHLIHEITLEDFADIYAETIAYGMFAARLHDDTPETFSRQEALSLLPKTNPFLRNLFSYLAGVNLDERIAWIIDDLANIFRFSDVPKIMHAFGRLTGQNDPFLHFYETFLAAYNPAKRKSRGVWYTPEPVVNFIVRATDLVLRTEFGLSDGLADTSKVNIKWDTGQTSKRGKSIVTTKDVHRVQILDPATGTGTFLAEVIKQIAPVVKEVGNAAWSDYVEKDLIPRLHGFELLMASYAMCHMKLDMILSELHYKPSANPPRFSVFLTNSLEEGEPANQALPFAQWLTNEVKQANTIKRDMPIMCLIGNPPYLGEGGKSEGWLGTLMDDYKKEPGGKIRLAEGAKWVNDLYAKFVRVSSHLIEKNGEGVLGFITNHGYLDNPTFRGMRWHLLNTFDKVWILDLHGSSKKVESPPNGIDDKNVFDIMQGVSIIIAVKLKRSATSKKKLASVKHGDLWGSRASKYDKLWSTGLDSKLFKPLDCVPPQYAFARRDFSKLDEYSAGVLLNELMPVHGNGIVTKRDELNIHRTAEGVRQMVDDFLTLPEKDVRRKYNIRPDVRDWKYEWAKKDITDQRGEVPVLEIGYRLFDSRYMFNSGRARGLVGWPVADLMRHYSTGSNIGLLTSKAHRDAEFAHVFITDKPTEAIHFSATTGSNAFNFPLYLLPESDELEPEPQVNFDLKLFRKFQSVSKHVRHGVADELSLFDYIYGVLHSPKYRREYADFLRTDFPRIPWPQNASEFWRIAKLGGSLRSLHLMDSKALGACQFPFSGSGTNIVERYEFIEGNVWVNDSQYFSGIPQQVWNLYIGGYLPARKWLKDRKNSKLDFQSIKQYQRIIKVLIRTDEIMAEL